MRYLAGKDNIVADAVSRVEEFSAGINHEVLAQSQQNDAKLRAFLQGDTSLKHTRIQIPRTSASVFRNISTVVARR